MNRTVHGESLEKAFYEAIDADPKVASFAAEIRQRLVRGSFYSLDIVNAVFQKWDGDREITLVDAFGFAHVWSHYLSGDIAYCSVPLPSGPGADRETEFNQSILDQLPDGFKSSFDPQKGGSADDDGSFTIEKGIGLWRTFLEENKERHEQGFFPTDHTIALEVGTTSVSKTLYHIRGRQGVARWPYGYDKIIVLATAEPGFVSRRIGKKKRSDP